MYFANGSEPPQPGRLLLIIHHLMVDGVSWRILLDDVETLCDQLRHNKALLLGPKTSSVQLWGAVVGEYATSEALASERDHWVNAVSLQEQQVSLPQTLSNLTGVGNLIGVGHTSFELDESTTTNLLQQAGQAYRTQINELLLAGLLLGFNAWSGTNSIRIDLEGHGREDLDETIDLSQTVGWFTSLYPLTLSSDSFDYQSLICAVKEQTRATPNRGIGFGLLKYLARDEALLSAPAGEILFNYLGQFDQSINDDNYLNPASESMGSTVSERRKQTYGLAFNGAVNDGRLNFGLNFDRARYTEQSMQALAGHVQAGLITLVNHCLEADAGCLTPSDFALANISADNLKQWAVTYDLADIYPATSMQQGLLFHSALDRSAYITQIEFNIEGGLNSTDFCSAWTQVMNRHDILRTAFVSDDTGKMLQLVLKTAKLDWHEHDLADLASNQQLQTIKAARVQDKQQGFDSTVAPMMRFNLWSLGNDNWTVLWSFHHALLDGWCVPILYAEVGTIYQLLQADQSLQTGQARVALPQPKRYRDYIAWLNAQDEAKAIEYWQQQLIDAEPVVLPERLGINEGINDGANDTQGISIAQLTLNEAQTAQLQQLVRQTRTTMNIVVQAAWSYLLSVYGNTCSVTFGATVSGRPPALKGVEQMIGLFINTLVVRVDMPDQTSVSDWLAQLLKAQVARDEFGYLPLADIQRAAGPTELFDTLVVFENFPVQSAMEGAPESGLNVASINGYEATNYGVTLTVSLADVLDITIECKSARYGEELAQTLIDHLAQVLGAMSADANCHVNELPLLADEELQYLLHTVNDTKADNPQALLVHQLFERQAQQYPDKTALVANDICLSYFEVNQQANRLAHYLRAQGVTADSLVGLSVKRSPNMVIAVLAILKAGGAYVPLDPAYPQARLDYMIQDSGITLLLDHDTLEQALSGSNKKYSSENPQNTAEHQVSGENLAYVIYTSGSTGQPKGVMVTHANVQSYCFAAKELYNIDSEDRVLQFSSISFDIFVEETFATLCFGATLVLRDESVMNGGVHFWQFMKEHQISVMSLPTAFWHMLCSDLDKPLLASLAALRLIVLGGEAMSLTQLKRWQGVAGSSIRLLNTYGPTEGTVIASAFDATDWQSKHCLPIGKPIQNTQLYVLGPQGQVQPKGVIGELYIGGAGVARGYLNRPELSLECCVPNPFGAHITADLTANSTANATSQDRLYKTGDIVRYLADGNLEFVGRVDAQVKIRGLRIELGEIEHQLAQLPGVNSTVVVVIENQLVAYLTCDTAYDSANDTSTSEFKTQLQSVLPAHMVPTHFVELDANPLTPNAKVDKKA
ncbi:MAG: amino acid adenylation domain-containing protein, partial [Psychrosphaera sp.]|nr:amino acid adenylation domain-containing protein [Psychrosphaera sp.]